MAERVLTLAIESSNPSAGPEPGVAVGWTAPGHCETLGEEPLGAGERHDDLLMPAVDRLFKRLNVQPDQIGRVAVSIGPGGYTGLRIASAAANMIALATDAPVVSVPSASVVARALARQGPVLVCLASKRDSAWITRCGPDGRPLDPGRLASADDLNLQPPDALVGDRFLPDSFRERAAEVGCEVVEPVFRAPACLALAWSFEARKAGEATPLYGREAEAVTRWRELHGPK